MRFQILGQRIVIQPRIPECSSVLERPEIAKDDYAEDGVIVQVGPEVPKHLEVGMHVGFHPGAGERMKIDGQDTLVLNTNDLRCFFDREPPDAPA